MSKKINKIIVACDCSDFSARIFAYAVEVARGLEAELIVTNVINRVELDRNKINRVELDRIDRTMTGDPVFSIEEYIENKKKFRVKMIEKLIQATDQPGLFKKTIIKTGTPFQELITAIKEEKADLLIMGNKGRGNLEGVLVGSCAEKLFRRCPVALLSLRVSKGKRIL